MKDEIRHHLSSKAEAMQVEVPHEPKKGSRRQAPLAAAAAAMAMVLAVGVTVPLVSGGDDETDGIEIPARNDDLSASTETQTAAATRPGGTASSVAPELVAAGDGPTLTWQQGTFPDDGFFYGATAFEGGFLAWGAENRPQEEAEFVSTFALWFSSDGFTWERVDSSGLGVGQNEWVNQVISVDGGLVAVGAAFDPPREARPESSFAPPQNERTVVWSSTDGRTWVRTELDQDLPTSDTPGELWYGGQALVASSGGRVVMVQSHMLEFDPSSIVEQKLSDLGIVDFNGLGMDDDGVEVFGGQEAEELIAQFSYEELGVDPALFRDGPQRTETITTSFVSTDGGSSWTRSDTSGFDDLGYLNGMVGTNNGFLAVGDTQYDQQGGGGPATWTSTDGVNWTKVANVDTYVYNLSAFGDLIVAPGEKLVLSRDGGSTWNTLTGPAFDDVDDLHFSLDQAAVGAFGIVASGSAWSEGPPPPDLVLEKDGLIYRESYDQDYQQTVTVTDAATGEVRLEVDNYYSPEWIVENDDSFTVLNPDTGEEVITIGYMQMELGFGGIGNVVTVEVDGLVYTEDWEQDRITVTNAETGEVVVDILSARQPAHMRQDDEGFTLLDPETGEDLMSITYQEMETAYRSQYVEQEVLYEQPVMAVWYSQDGTAWSRQDMRDAFGDSGYMSGLVSGTDRVVVVFMPEPDFYPESEDEALAYTPPPSQVWVGTLGG